MAGTAQQLKLRLFLEGVEVPVIAASVQTAPNSPAVASIQIPPLPTGLEFLPRTLVHLFFLDFYETQSPFVSSRGVSPTNAKAQQDPTVYEQSVVETQSQGLDLDADNFLKQRYKLLFGGEVRGFAWSKSDRSRSLVLQCLDWSNYWDYAYQWNNTDLFGPGIKAMFSGGATNLFTDFLEEEGQAIIRIIQQPSVQYPKLKGLLGGLIHLIEAIGGSYYYPKQFAGQNLFFSLAELRLHITQLVTAYEKDPTASRLLNADGYDGLFGRTLGGLGQQVSIRQAINALMGVIFHETYSIPTPLYVPGTGGSVSGSVRKPIANDPRYKNIPDTCNQIISTISDIKTSLTTASVLSSGKNPAQLKESLTSRFQMMETSLKTVILTATDKAIQPVKGFLSSAQRAIGQSKTLAQKWRPGADPKTVSGITAPLDDAAANLKRASEFETVQSSGTKGIPARLNQQIFRPDVWFSAPPRCNVLFPEHYNSINYARDFLAEPTRFLLKTNDEFFGEDELFDQFYFAPKSFTVKAQKRTLNAMLSNDLLDHELFTGILPVFEKMGELNIFAARSGTMNGKVPKIGLAQRSTNFLYFKYRFAARQMTVNGRFNPYVVPGFPGLVIDAWTDAQALSDRQQLINKFGGVNTDINKLLGAHFLGNFTEVEHVVDQSGGKTNIVMSYARSPSEGVEFLGATRDDQRVQKRFGEDALRTTDVAALNPPKILSLGPNYGQITAVQEVTSEYRGTADGQGPLLPLFDGPRRDGTGESRIKVPVGIIMSALAYGQDVATLVGDPNAQLMFRAFRLSEQVPRYRQETVDLPAEEYIRPGWYGDIWHPALIGQAYQQFFQTGAITDQQQVADANGASVGVPFQEAEDALAAAAQGVTFDDPRVQAPALLTLDKNSSIEAAVGFLTQTYSYVKLAGNVDVDEFIRSYVWRPIASMVDMFGTQDLQLSADGHTVVQGIEGFHSRAFGPYEDLFGLVTPDLNSIIGIKRGSTVAQRADVRKRRQDIVKQYVAALQFARAILG
jgi:hypothetical protein